MNTYNLDCMRCCRNLILLVVFAWTGAVAAQLPNHFPLYQEVVDTLEQRLTCYALLDNHHKIDVLKNKGGFWVTLSHYQTDYTWKQQAPQLVWSPKTGYVASIVITGDQVPKAIYGVDFVSPPAIEARFDDYNLHVFFGNKNWIEDNIQHYQQQPPRSHLEYYSLGRVYSYKYNTYIYKQKKVTTSNTTSIWLDSIAIFGARAIHYFQKVYELEPTYQTGVGGIYTKYSNEIVSLYGAWAVLGLKERAVKTLEGQDLYTQTTLLFARNILESCPPKAILFTYGDNNTYPLLYAQQVSQTRTDVLVVNEQLLQLQVYIQHLCDVAYYHEKALQCGLSPSAYADDNNDYLLLKRNFEEEPWPISKLIQLLEGPPERVRTIGTYGFLLGEGADQVSLICAQTYLRRASFMLLGILEENYGKRPILFSPGYAYLYPISIVHATGVGKYFYITGINSKIQCRPSIKETSNKIEAIRNYYFFKEQFDWPSLTEVILEDQSNVYCLLYKIQDISKYLEKEGDAEKSEDLRKLFYTKMKAVLPKMYPQIILRLIAQYYESGQYDRANTLLESTLDYPIQQQQPIKVTASFQETLDHLTKLLKDQKNTPLSQKFQTLQASFLYPVPKN